MRINIVTGALLPVPAIEGGAVNRLWQGIAEIFAAKNNEVTIIARTHYQQPRSEIINGVKYIRKGGFNQSTNNKLDLIKDLYYSLTILPHIPDGDILIINDFWLPVFAPLKKQLGKIVINVNRFPKGQYWLYRKTDLFTAASEIIKQTIIQQCPVITQKIKVIPNPINTDIFCPPKSPKKIKKEILILYIGRIHPEKGIHILIEAFKILYPDISHIKLKIIGPHKENQGGGGDRYFQSLKNKTINLPIEFCPPIFEQEKLAKAYQEADLFCYPSLADRGEAFGVAPLEAMATGLVPIVSNLDCFKDFILDNYNGYFFEHKTNKPQLNLASKLQQAILQIDRTLAMGIEARKKALQFSYQNIAQLYLQEFDRFIYSR